MTGEHPRENSNARVGIVVVSHSAKLAKGVVDLAREMAGPDVPIVAAGGLAADEAALGTDVELIQRAIEAAYSDAGVLVLMDLGSALLTAEMAVEACPPPWRSRILLGDAPLVEGAVAAAVQARLGSPLGDVAAVARGALVPKVSQLGQGLGDGGVRSLLGGWGVEKERPHPRPLPEGEGTSLPQPPLRVVVNNPHGLHARPAARLIATVARFQADVHVRNLTTGQGPCSARSLVGLATLGAMPGHTVEFAASGPDAAEALKAIEELAATGFGEGGERGLTPSPSPAELQRGEPWERGAEAALWGLPGAPGVALGEAWPWRTVAVATDEGGGDPQAEWSRLLEALGRARDQLAALRDTLRQAGQTTEAEIIATHLNYLADEAILHAARELVFAKGENAADAWRKAITDAVARFEALPDAYARARAADLTDVGNRVLTFLGPSVTSSTLPTSPVVLIADDLGPADVALLDRSVVRAICLARGAPTSHAAILARGLGTPAVVGLGTAILAVPAGTPLLVDGALGTVWPNPDATVRVRYADQLAKTSEAVVPLPTRPKVHPAPREGTADLSLPPRTHDGVAIPVLANVGGLAEAKAAFAAGAAGIGLLRTEFLFLGRSAPPSEDEQFAAYADIARALDGRPATIRTLDAGGDKPVPYLGPGREDNPFLGSRSIRLSLEHPELFAAQLRAIVRVAAIAPVRVMFPFIATLDEWRAARDILRESVREVRGRGLTVPDALSVGIMVEVPAAALVADQFAAEVDFFSIGTNDLAQYTMAADRGNPALASLADALQPAVLRLIQMAANAARAHGKPVSVCGEIAANSLAVPLLIGLGVDSLSVAPSAVPVIRAAVSAVRVARAKELALTALSQRTVAELRALVQKQGG